MNRLGLLAALVLPVAALAGTPHLVRDVNSTIIPIDASPSDFLDQGTWSFFVASDGVRGGEPWATDGTLAGTVRLGAVNPLPFGVTGYQTVRAGTFTYFFTTNLNAGDTLWKSDGTAAGTQLVADLDGSGVNPGLVGALDGNLIFTLFQSDAGRELWRSDGTAAGTYRIRNVNGANTGAVAPIIANGKIYFFADTGNGSFEPWVSDGTEAGTQRITQIPGAAPDLYHPTFTRVGQYLLLDFETSATGKELWRIDLNTNAVSQVADIAPGTTSSITYANFGSLGAVALFLASDTGSSTPALWRSDGTQAGTYFLANVRPVSSPLYMGPTDTSRFIFLGEDGTGAKLWSSDGSSAIALTPSSAMLLGEVGGKVYFVMGAGSSPELWSTDGTPAGTRRLTEFPAGAIDAFEVAGSSSQLYVRTKRLGDFNVYRYDTAAGATLLRSYSLPLNQGAFPTVFAFAQGRLYFDSSHPLTGRELWTSDGTPAGTRLVRNIAPETRTQASAPSHFFEFGGLLYFTADDGVSGREVWRSDGTPGGTQLVSDVNPGPSSSDPLTFFGLGDKLYFFAKDGATADSYKLWSTDGTAAGTSLVSAVIPRSALLGGQAPCGPPVVTLAGRAYFTGYDSVWGTELWRTDGTSAGTTHVTDINPGFSTTDLCWLALYQNRLFFAAQESGTSGVELWSVDGTGGAPGLVADINPGTSSSNPMELQVFNGALYFFATGATTGQQLWTSNGTAAGTQVVSSGGGGSASSLVVAGGKLVFLRTSGPALAQLWASDGTSSGTARVGTVSAFGPLHSDGTRAYFRGLGTPAGTSAPWVTDGTVAGTHVIVDTGTPPTAPIPFWDFLGVTLFQTTGLSGQAKLWRTNGTAAGTLEIGNVGVISSAAYPVTVQTAGQTFFYATDDGSTGVELFAIDNDAPLAADDAAGSVQAGQALVVSVLSNDSDPDGQLDADSVIVLTQPAGGVVSVGASGAITYTANATFSGQDQFTYSVDDNQGERSQPATVRVTVTAAPANPPPTNPPPTTPPPASSGGGGGGGAFGVPGLLGLLLVFAFKQAPARSLRRSSCRGSRTGCDVALQLGRSR